MFWMLRSVPGRITLNLVLSPPVETDGLHAGGCSWFEKLTTRFPITPVVP